MTHTDGHPPATRALEADPADSVLEGPSNQMGMLTGPATVSVVARFTRS
jgi:hypothetical protein